MVLFLLYLRFSNYTLFYLVKYKGGEATNDQYQNFKDLSVLYFLELVLIHEVLEEHLKCLVFTNFEN